MSDPAVVVRAYFDAVASNDANAVVALFATDAELYSATGILVGKAAIGGMYERVLTGGEKPGPGPLLVDGDHVAVEIELDASGTVLRLADFFTIRDGEIQRLAIYGLPPSNAD